MKIELRSYYPYKGSPVREKVKLFIDDHELECFISVTHDHKVKDRTKPNIILELAVDEYITSREYSTASEKTLIERHQR